MSPSGIGNGLRGQISCPVASVLLQLFPRKVGTSSQGFDMYDIIVDDKVEIGDE